MDGERGVECVVDIVVLMEPGGCHEVLTIGKAGKGPTGCSTASPHVVVVAPIGRGNQTVALISEPTLGKAFIPIIENRD